MKREPLRIRQKLQPASRVKVALPKKVAAPFYTSPAWRALVDHLKVVRFGSIEKARCEDPQCLRPNRAVTIRVVGDHVTELRDGGAPLDSDNILFRCFSCHTRVTAERRGLRYRGAPR